MMLQQDKQIREIKVQHFKKCVPFINCKSDTENNIEIDDDKDIGIVMLMYNLIE